MDQDGFIMHLIIEQAAAVSIMDALFHTELHIVRRLRTQKLKLIGKNWR